VYNPVAWSSLPAAIRGLTPSPSHFHSHLKKELFSSLAYGINLSQHVHYKNRQKEIPVLSWTEHTQPIHNDNQNPIPNTKQPNSEPSE